MMKEKKCKNCPICLEGMNHQFKDSIDLITELNANLMNTRQENDSLTNQLHRANALISDVSQNNFALLRVKTQDFLRSYDHMKKGFERKLMEVED